MNGPQEQTMKTALEAIARRTLYLETLQAADLDSIDCREHCVTAIAEALQAAYLAGFEARSTEEDETMSEHTQFTLEVDGAPDLRFSGEKIAGTSNSPDRASGDWSGETGRWTTLRLYRTAGGKYVCQRIDHTQWQGERDTHRAEVCDSLEAVRTFFGHGRLAKDLYFEAGIDAVREID